ncbi:MAG: hypothetical protein ACODAE_08240, partial [Gemmatimonadota bacterium]
MEEPAVHDALVEARTIDLLRRVGDAPVPLPRLYADVVRELGPVVSGPDQLRDRLRRRPERFIVLEPPGDPAWTDLWSDEARRRYAAALERTALSPEPRVALAPAGSTPETADTVPDRVDASIRALAGA